MRKLNYAQTRSSNVQLRTDLLYTNMECLHEQSVFTNKRV